jgi:replicative DNA helicase
MPGDDTGTPLRAAERTATLTNTKAEQYLLGTLMRRNEVFHRVVEIVRLTDFAVPLHARIFEAIGRLIALGDEASPVTLQHEFDSHYLAGISDPPTLINGEGYARLIRDLAQRRIFIVACEDGIEAASRTDRPFSEITEAFDRRVIEIDDISGGAKPMSALIAALAAAERTYKGETGLTTGLADLDKKLGGLRRSELVIVAGRPSMGKSALAVDMGRAAARAGKEVLIFSLEMSDEQLGARELAVATGISAQDQRRAISREQMLALSSAGPEIAALRTMCVEDAPANLAQLRARALRHKRRRGALET